MAKDNVVFPIGLKKLWEHFDGTSTLDTDLHAVVLSDGYDPEADQIVATDMTTAVASYWGGTLANGGSSTTDPLVTSSFTLTITTNSLALIFADLEFGAMTGTLTATPKYVMLYLESSTPSTDADRFPLACLRCSFTPVLNDSLTYATDDTGVVLWRC